MLDNSRKRHADACEDEAPCNARDGVHRKPVAAEERVDDFIEKRDAEDDDYGVDILHLIVGHAMQFHLRSLPDKIRIELVVDDPEDRVEEENAAGDESATEFVDESFVPRCFVFLTMSCCQCQ